MLRRFGKDAGSLLGIEITSSAVRLVQLQARGRSVWAIEPLPSAAFVSGQVLEPETVAAALRQAVARSGASTRQAALALPASAVINRSLMLPAGLGEEAIDERLRSEIEPLVPFALDEAAVDFQIVGECPLDPGLVEVAFSVCHQAGIEALEATLELAGLRAWVVDIDSYALLRPIAHDSAGSSAILQVEVDGLVLHRQAGAALGTRGEIRNPGVVSPALILECMQRWLVDHQQAPPEKLWLCGSGANDDVLAEHLQQQLGVETAVFRGLPMACEVAPSLMLAYGLALRGAQ